MNLVGLYTLVVILNAGAAAGFGLQALASEHDRGRNFRLCVAWLFLLVLNLLTLVLHASK